MEASGELTFTPSTEASMIGSLETLQPLLLVTRATVAAADLSGRTSISTALAAGHVTVEALLQERLGKC